MKRPEFRLDAVLCTFIDSALPCDEVASSALLGEATGYLRRSGGFGVGLDVMADAALAGALGALAGLGYVPTTDHPFEALAGASVAINATRVQLIRDTIANDDRYLAAKRGVYDLDWRDEHLERLKGEFAPAFAALRKRRDVLQSAEGARDCARGAYGFAAMISPEMEPDHQAHWARESARSAGNALWFAKATVPEVVTAALRGVFDAIPQLGIKRS